MPPKVSPSHNLQPGTVVFSGIATGPHDIHTSHCDVEKRKTQARCERWSLPPQRESLPISSASASEAGRVHALVP